MREISAHKTFFFFINKTFHPEVRLINIGLSCWLGAINRLKEKKNHLKGDFGVTLYFLKLK